MIEGYDDQMVTHSQLAKRFEEYIKSIPANDFVIAPFSEITRFYDNEVYAEFDSLLKTIRLIQSPQNAQDSHQRIYVPIIGMQCKIIRFKDDPNINIWEYHSGKDVENYQLILTRGTTYGVQGLETDFTLCHSLKEWIELWKIGCQVKQHIICSSKCIYDNSANAHPDNAFNYITCQNAYDFLKKGLEIDLGCLTLNEDDLSKWEQLAKNINCSHFNFDEYVNGYFNTLSLNDGVDFVSAWFDEDDEYSRWILKMYYIKKFNDSTYLNRVLINCPSFSTSELFSALATRIFDEPFSEESLKQRCAILSEASKHNVTITDMAERKVRTKLEAIAANSECGYYYALKYLTSLTTSEKLLLVKWVGTGMIENKDCKTLFPELYYYLSQFSLQLETRKQWINDYFDEYRKSKVANHVTNSLTTIIKERNASPSAFESWRNKFKTVKTLLSGRDDIEVFYWIDGLGVDWLPFISKVIEKHQVDGVYLNEIHIATSELPTCTDNNKLKLQEFSPSGLEKIGDIDTYAHSHKIYPDYIVNEMDIVEEAISTVLSQYSGKKIAFISDHGISYLANLSSGLNLGGIKTNHEGRCGRWENSTPHSDNKYIILDDGKTICSLTHASLTSKTLDGHGAHGGATPEEVLVPIIIVSNQKNATSYSAKLIDNEISASNPVIKYVIKGLSNIDTPKLIYNGVEYKLNYKDENIYESESLSLEETSKNMKLIIGDFVQTDSIIINTGVEEDDLFKDF